MSTAAAARAVLEAALAYHDASLGHGDRLWTGAMLRIRADEYGREVARERESERRREARGA